MKPEFGPFYRTTLTMFLEHYDFLNKSLTDFEAAIEKAVVPYAEQMVLLQTIPGVEKIAAWQLIAALGVVESGKPRECGGAVQRTNEESEQVPASGFDAIGVGEFASEGRLFAGGVLSDQGQGGGEEGGDCVFNSEDEGAIPGVGRGLFR